MVVTWVAREGRLSMPNQTTAAGSAELAFDATMLSEAAMSFRMESDRRGSCLESGHLEAPARRPLSDRADHVVPRASQSKEKPGILHLC